MATKAKSITHQSTSQLSLFNVDNFSGTQPLPLKASKHFGFPLQYHLVNDEHWYSLQDWIRGLTGETDAKKISQIINVYRKESDFDLKSKSQKLVYIASDGKTYKRDFVSDIDLYRVAAYLRQTSDRHSLKAVKEYLARAGAFVDRMLQSPEWAKARLDGIISRKALMQAIRDALNPPARIYAEATNEIYRGVFKRDSKELAEALGTENPRDKMTVPALRYLDIAEWAASQRIGEAENISVAEGMRIIRQTANTIGAQVLELEAELGIDLPTGRKTIGG